MKRRNIHDVRTSYDQPAPGAGTSTVSTWPVRAPSAMLVVPCHSVAIMNSVLLLAPPSAQAKHPRSRSTVWGAAVEVGPHPPVRQAAVSRDVEGCEFLAIGLGHNQGRVVGRHYHAIWECDAIRYLPGRAMRGDQSDDAGGELAAWKVKADVVDVGVAPTIHDDLVPGVIREASQVSICYQRPIGLHAEEQSIARRDDKQAPIGQK